MSTTLYDKIWNDHLVDQQDDGTALLFVDRHLVHEVTSPQAFEGLRNSNRKVRHPNLTLAVADHNVPTTDRTKGIADAESKIQVDTLEANCKEFGVQLTVRYLCNPRKRRGSENDIWQAILSNFTSNTSWWYVLSIFNYFLDNHDSIFYFIHPSIIFSHTAE